MKTLRLVVLIVFAVLLPVRGAMAAAMLCPTLGAVGDHAVHAMASDHDAGMDAEMEVAPDEAMPADAEHAGHTGHGGHADHGTCTLWCDLRAMTAMPASLPSLPLQEAATAPVFAAPPTPALSFLLDGQDRPPRSS